MKNQKIPTKKPEPGFLEQADKMIDESYAIPVEDPRYGHGLMPRDHKLLVRLMDLHMKVIKDDNDAFRLKIIADVEEIIRDQWPNAFWRAQKSILKWLTLAVIIAVLLSVSITFILITWYHNHYLLEPISAILSMLRI